MSGHANTCQCHNANPPWACTCGDDLRQARVENQQLRDALSEVITLCERHGAVRTAVVAARAALAGTPSEDT
jgi:hypothetical protein